MKSKITGFGGTALDYIFHINRWPGANETCYVTHSSVAAGGMTLGALMAASKLGMDCSYCGALGDDEEGTELISHMEKWNIKSGNVRRLGSSHSPVSRIMLDPQGNRTIFHRRGVRDTDYLKELDEVFLEETDLLLLDGSWMKNSIKWAEEAVKKDIPVVLDLSPNNAHPLRDDLIALCTYPVLNAELCSKITECEDPRGRLELMVKRYGKSIIITDGARGIDWAVPGEEPQHKKAFPIETVDSNGAGDTFHGAFAAAICRRMDLKIALAYAMAAASLKCAADGRENLPDHRKVKDFLISCT